MSKIARPDRGSFDKEFNALKEKLAEHHSAHRKASESLRSAGNTKNDPEWQKLLDELNAAKKERDTARSSVSGIQNEIRGLETEHKKKLSEISAIRPKSGPKSEEEFSRTIKSLEDQVEAGNLKLVDEKKVLREIGALKAAKKSVSGIPKLEAEASELKKKIADKRKTVDDSALKAANAQIAEINGRLDERKAARSESAKVKSAFWDAKRDAEDKMKAVRDAMDAARTEFNTKMAAYREATAEERRKRAEEEKAQKEASARAKKLAEAEAKVEAAKEPAFSAQIAKANTLLDFFGPWAPKDNDVEEAPAKELAEVSIQKAKIAAPVSRKELKRKGKAQSANKKLNLDVGVIEGLSELNIPIPKSSQDAEQISQKLKEKIEYYKANSDRVAKEKVERAQEALEKVKAENAKSATESSDASEAKVAAEETTKETTTSA